jgi:hypothetical protein
VKRLRAGLACAAALVAGCSPSSEPARDRPARGSGVIAATPGDAAVADAAAGTAAIKRHMKEHFAAASELQRAIARGHLADARGQAQWLIDHDEPALDGWQPFVDEMRAAARAVVQAADLPAAGALASRLGRACSRCHEARAAVVTFAWEPPADDAPALQVQMKRHQWAAARLWEGLVGPSDEMWGEGTGVLATARLDTALVTGGAPRGDVAALAAKVRELAGRARTVTGHDERATLYGELLSTCAGCHQLVRPNPVPGP